MKQGYTRKLSQYLTISQMHICKMKKAKIELKLVRVKDRGEEVYVDNEGNAIVMRGADFVYESEGGAIKLKFSYCAETKGDIERFKKKKVYVVFEDYSQSLHNGVENG